MTTKIPGRYVSRQSCPHCAGPLKIKTNKKITPTFQEIYFYCDGDTDCGWRGVASLTFERTITPSGTPNPAIKLPISAPREKRQAQHETATSAAAGL